MQGKQRDTARGRALFCRLHQTLALAPALLPLPIYAYGVAARVSLGAWPYYGHPDPKDLGFLGRLDWLWFATVVGLLLSVAWVGFLPLAVKSQRGKALLADVLLFAGAVSLVVVSFRIDPGGLVDWYFD